MSQGRTVCQILGLAAAMGGLWWYAFPDKKALAGKPERGAKILVPGEERHFRNVKQLTNGGENAECYWSYDSKKLVMQSTRDGLKADQIFTMNADGSNLKMVSTGKGRTTCSYYLKGDKEIVYASTHLASPEPPPAPDQSQGYVWAVYSSFDIFRANADGSNVRPLTTNPGYDAEATVSPDGTKIVFTSTRDGDLDLYLMDIDGKNVKRLTTQLGYDGGAFFSPDGKKICFRAGRPQGEAEIAEYKKLLEQNLVKPSRMELYVMNVDGTGLQQVTNNGAANFCPFFTPDGQKLIFSSNLENPRGRNFDLYLINPDGTGQERLTFEPTFDGFPMFSPNGKKIVWASNRNAKVRGETNIFVADWIP